MRPVVGSLLTSLGLMMAAGCVLPNASLPIGEQSRWHSKQFSEQAETDTQKRLSFKTPRRLSESELVSKDDQVSKVDQTDEVVTQQVGSSTEAPHDPNDAAVFTAGYSTDSSVPESNSIQLVQNASAKLGFEEIVSKDTAPDRQAGPKDTSPNPVQLQGLEIDDGKPSVTTSKAVISPWDHAGERVKKAEPRAASNDRLATQEAAPRKWPGIAADSRSLATPYPRTPLPPTAEVLKQPSRTGALQQASATTSPTADTAASWRTELDQLIAHLEQDLARLPADSANESHGDYLRKQAHLRMLYLMAERQEEALTAIPQASSSQQEFWQQMIWAMSNSLDSEQFPDSDERAAQTLSPLSSALRQMREEAPLSIKNISFCRKISYFGNYDRFPRNEFTPGYEVLLYTEIENFTSTPTVDGEYRTSLKSLMEITDASGKVVWTKGFPPTEDFCRNPRRDYFHNYQFHIPEDLPIGTYSLKLTIVDELSHKRVSSSLGFVLK